MTTIGSPAPWSTKPVANSGSTTSLTGAIPPPMPLPETVTGEWPADRPPADTPTVTSSGSSPAGGEFGIPNPFGRYAIHRLLGRGGMGAVFLAHDTQLDRPVALKVPAFGGTLTAAQKERF